MTMPGDPDATLPVPGYGAPQGADPTLPAQPGYGGGPVGGGPGPGGGWEDEGDDRRRLWMIAGAVLVLGLLIGALIAVLSSGGGGSKSASSTSSSSTSSSSTSTSSTSSTTSTTTAQGPKILQFTVTPNPVSCPTSSSTPNVTVTWSTQNTTGVTISIDNPNGPYGTYPQATGQTQVPFTCSVNPVQHTYYLTANGTNGQKGQQSVVVTGTIVAPTTTTSH